jgi:hypothetical protein
VEQNKNQDTNPHHYAQLVFNKSAKNIQWRKDSLFNKCCRENWISACRKLKFITLYNINSKCIKGLNVRPETLKLVQERAGNTLEQ